MFFGRRVDDFDAVIGVALRLNRLDELWREQLKQFLRDECLLQQEVPGDQPLNHMQKMVFLTHHVQVPLEELQIDPGHVQGLGMRFERELPIEVT